MSRRVDLPFAAVRQDTLANQISASGVLPFFRLIDLVWRFQPGSPVTKSLHSEVAQSSFNGRAASTGTRSILPGSVLYEPIGEEWGGNSGTASAMAQIGR